MSHYLDIYEAMELEEVANKMAVERGLNVSPSGYKTKQHRIAANENKIYDLKCVIEKSSKELEQLEREIVQIKHEPDNNDVIWEQVQRDLYRR